MQKNGVLYNVERISDDHIFSFFLIFYLCSFSLLDSLHIIYFLYSLIFPHSCHLFLSFFLSLFLSFFLSFPSAKLWQNPIKKKPPLYCKALAKNTLEHLQSKTLVNIKKICLFSIDIFL